jgi:DNA-binding LacI/PurR family transcriptional regulator
LSLVLIPDRTIQPGARAAAVADAMVDGFVVYSLRNGDPLLDAVLQRGVSTVVIDSPRTVAGADWVGADDRSAMRRLGEYLRSLGHRRVGIIAPQVNETRLNGPVEADRWRSSGYALMRERIEGLLAGLDLDPAAVLVEERSTPISRRGLTPSARCCSGVPASPPCAASPMYRRWTPSPPPGNGESSFPIG